MLKDLQIHICVQTFRKIKDLKHLLVIVLLPHLSSSLWCVINFLVMDLLCTKVPKYLTQKIKTLTTNWQHFLFKGNFIVYIINIIANLASAETLALIIPTPQNVGGGAILDSLCPVGRSVGRSPIHVRSITPLLMERFPSNLNDTFTSTRGCAEPLLPCVSSRSRSQLKVKY